MELATSTDIPTEDCSTKDRSRLPGSMKDGSIGMFYFLTNVVMVGLLCFFGFIGNTLIVIVLQRDGIKTSNSVILQMLAMSDNCYLVYVWCTSCCHLFTEKLGIWASLMNTRILLSHHHALCVNSLNHVNVDRNGHHY
jgi:hypothetical protein